MIHYFDPEVRTARKKHYCFWCGEKIYQSQPYVDQACFDDCFYHLKYHYECWDALKHFDDYPEDGLDEYSMKRGRNEWKD